MKNREIDDPTVFEFCKHPSCVSQAKYNGYCGRHAKREKTIKLTNAQKKLIREGHAIEIIRDLRTNGLSFDVARQVVAQYRNKINP